MADPGTADQPQLGQLPGVRTEICRIMTSTAVVGSQEGEILREMQ